MDALDRGRRAPYLLRWLAANREHYAFESGTLCGSTAAEALRAVCCFRWGERGWNCCWSFPRFFKQYHWHEADRFRKDALHPATGVEDARVRRSIGRRLLDEARYHQAADEFQWAADL